MGTPAVDAAGNIYGTTQGTGYYYQNPYGSAFKISPQNVFTRLHEFCDLSGCTDGFYPQSDITLDAKGNLYGTTSTGGTRQKGTVFKISPAGTVTVLHSFCSNNIAGICVDGDQPEGSVIVDSLGTVYGLTYNGGKQGYGLLYKINPTTNALSYVYSFCATAGCIDGQRPDGRLLNDGKGSLYGVTYYGGAYGYGTLFKVSIATRHITTLYSFCRLSGCPDGGYPRGGLVRDSAGNIYGVTSYGGGSSSSGVLYKITPGKVYTVLRKFCTFSFCTDGQRPNGGLAISPTGIIYGTTNAGGNTSGRGVLFRYDTVKKAYGVTYSFCAQTGCNDGATPATDAGVAIDKAGNLYGTTTYGGKGNQGIVYKVTP
jgi:uncharacterized repeat protein (TIGR03803 family)